MRRNWLRFNKKHLLENPYLVAIPLYYKLNVTAKKTNYLRSLFCTDISNVYALNPVFMYLLYICN